MTAMRFLVLSFVVATAAAFQPVPRRERASLMVLKAKIDEAKIKDAAEHFGKYSVKEIEEMKNELHMERIQSLMFDRSNMINAEKAAEQRVWEENLELQLSMLKENIVKETPNVTLFPEVEEVMEELPHLKDGTLAQKGVEQEKLFIFEEAFLEENVIETIAFCGILAILMWAPQII